MNVLTHMAGLMGRRCRNEAEKIQDGFFQPVTSRAHRSQGHGELGFTLAEIVAAMLIITILASIAYPSYTQYAQRARRAEAQTELLRIYAAQEKFYTACSTYTVNLTKLEPIAANCVIASTASTITMENYIYTATPLSILPLTASYLALATVNPTGKQAKDTDCWAFRVNSSGVKEFQVKGSGFFTPGPGVPKCWVS